MDIKIKKPFNVWFTHWTSGRRVVRIHRLVIDTRPGTKKLSFRFLRKS